MKFIVDWKSEELRKAFKGRTPVEVEADDRWSAVVQAAEFWGVAKLRKMQEIFDSTSVRKAEVGELRHWRKREVIKAVSIKVLDLRESPKSRRVR